MLIRTVTTDEDGYKQAYLSEPGDPPGTGIPSMPPSLDNLPWEEIKREIHNILVDHQVLTWADWQALASPFIALNPLRRALIKLYKTPPGGTPHE